MNLIDIYVTEIGRQLPGKNRSDIETELRSILQDMLDERSRKTGTPIDDAQILQVLQEYGSPEKVAASYRGERYLIGPKLYPAYIKVLQIVLPIIGVLALVGLGLSLLPMDTIIGAGIAEPIKSGLSSFLKVIGEATSSFFGSVISALGVITLIFALLERFAPDFKTDAGQWEARSLLKISPPDKIKPVELIVEIFFSGLAILVFNFFPQIIGFTASLNSLLETGSLELVNFVPLLSEAFFRYVPYLTILWAMTIVLNSLLFARGRWEVWSRWLSMAVKGLGIVIAVVMLFGPSLIAASVDLPFLDTLASGDGSSIFMSGLNLSVRLALFVSIVVGSVELVKSLIHIFQGRSVLTS